MCPFVTLRGHEGALSGMLWPTWIAVDNVTCRLQEVWPELSGKRRFRDRSRLTRIASAAGW
jgi:hypothetical protein